MIANDVVLGVTLQSLYFSRTVIHLESGDVWLARLRSLVPATSVVLAPVVEVVDDAEAVGVFVPARPVVPL